MAQFKLNETDEKFLALPEGAALMFAGTSGTETWIERERDTVVRIAVKSVAVATSGGGTLQASIEMAGAAAKGQDGPAPVESLLRVSQSVQVLVKAGQRLSFKAYPTASDALLLRTVVWAADLEHRPDARPAPNAESAKPAPAPR